MQQVSFTYSIHYTSPSTLKPTLETHTCSGVYTTTTERVGFGYDVRSEITHTLCSLSSLRFILLVIYHPGSLSSW